MTVCQTGDLGPGCLNLSNIYAGDQNNMGVTIRQGGVPVDITGLTFEAQARGKATDPDPAAITAVVSVADGPNGRLQVRWPGDQVRAAIDATGKGTWKGVWDLQQTFASGDPVTIIGGSAAAKYDVTR